jgi:hypothetical protein
VELWILCKNIKSYSNKEHAISELFSRFSLRIVKTRIYVGNVK